MSKEVAIKVENLSKLYRLGQITTGTLTHDLKRWAARVQGKEDPFMKVGEENDRTKKGGSDYTWVLKDINFEINKGDTLGIIGKNGAGKSTLLKILSRVTAPTKGEIKIKGRIASLLEVGTGFHPDLSGRENIYMNGAILGMTRHEITRKFDEIVDFAGIEKYVGTPVKRYSSGMYVRLAFAVAAFLEPEILIVDEVLAVGDAEFQRKCMGRLKDVSVNDGRTVIFVSHNMTAMQSLCNRTIMLERGQIKMTGDTDTVINHYLNTYVSTSSTKVWDEHESSGNDYARLRSVKVVDDEGVAISNSFIEEGVNIETTYQCLEEGSKLYVSLVIKNQKDDLIFITSSISEDVWSMNPHPLGTYKTTCKVPGNLLNDITYKVTVFLIRNSTDVIYTAEDIIIIEKTDPGNNRRGLYGKWGGLMRPILDWRTIKLDN